MRNWTDELVKETLEKAFAGDKKSQKEVASLIDNLRHWLGDQAQSLMEPEPEIDALLGCLEDEEDEDEDEDE